MARAWFGGGVADFVVSAPATGDPLRFAAATLTLWDAETAGTQVVDLLLGGVAVASVPVGTDGQVPSFQGPDGVYALWAQAGAGGGGRARLDAVSSIVEAAGGISDGIMATVDNDAWSAFRVQQDARLLASIGEQTGYVAHGSTAADLQAVLNALPAWTTGDAQRVVRVMNAPLGVWQLEATVTIPSGTVLDLTDAYFQLGAGLNVDCFANADPVGGNEAIVIRGGTVDGNGANQTGTGLSGDDETIPGRGIFLGNCTNSGVERTKIIDARMHGLLVYGGADNHALDVTAENCGSLADTRYGNGIYIWNSPRFLGDRLTAIDNDANSGVITNGGANAADIKLSNVTVIGGGASAISLNSLSPRLVGFHVYVSPTGFAGLNLGHDTTATLYCDSAIVADGVIDGAGSWGINLSGSLGAMFSNVRVTNSGYNSLRITGARAGQARFIGCVFDGVTINNTVERGQAVLITSAGSASAYGDVDFINCHARNALRAGVHVKGASRVRFIGGTVEDNGNGSFPGIYTEDDGALLCGSVVSIGTTFRDTRSGVSRTQQRPMQTTGTGGKSACLQYWSNNHLNSDAPLMTGATTDAASGYSGTLGALVPLTPTPGTAALPGYAFQGRANQGMFSLGSNTVGFAANGVEQCRYDTAKWQFVTPVRPGTYTTAGRPSAATVGAGAMAYDTTLSKPIWSDGTVWKDAAGTTV